MAIQSKHIVAIGSLVVLSIALYIGYRFQNLQKSSPLKVNQKLSTPSASVQSGSYINKPNQQQSNQKPSENIDSDVDPSDIFGKMPFFVRLKEEIAYYNYNMSMLYPDNTYRSYYNPKIVKKALKFQELDELTDIKYEIKDRKPTYFTAPEMQKWNALNWDLWELAYRWPLLQGLLSIKVDQPKASTEEDKSSGSTNGPAFPLFIIENEQEGGGTIGSGQV